MNQLQVTNGFLAVIEYAMKTPDEYINPNYLTELVDVIEAFHGVDEERLDNIRDYVQGLYEL